MHLHQSFTAWRPYLKHWQEYLGNVQIIVKKTQYVLVNSTLAILDLYETNLVIYWSHDLQCIRCINFGNNVQREDLWRAFPMGLLVNQYCLFFYDLIRRINFCSIFTSGCRPCPGARESPRNKIIFNKKMSLII